MTWIDVGEIMIPSVIGYNRNSALIVLSTTSYPNSERCSKQASNHCICEKSELVLALDLTLILPSPSLRTWRVFFEAKSNPGI
jgi:hypothetical protein